MTSKKKLTLFNLYDAFHHEGALGDVLFQRFWKLWYTQKFNFGMTFDFYGWFKLEQLPTLLAGDIRVIEENIMSSELSSILSSEFEDQDELQVLFFLSFVSFGAFLVSHLGMYTCLNAMENVICRREVAIIADETAAFHQKNRKASRLL